MDACSDYASFFVTFKKLNTKCFLSKNTKYTKNIMKNNSNIIQYFCEMRLRL